MDSTGNKTKFYPVISSIQKIRVYETKSVCRKLN